MSYTFVHTALPVLLAVLAIALFVAVGGDGEDVCRHAQWMGEVAARGSWVMW